MGEDLFNCKGIRKCPRLGISGITPLTLKKVFNLSTKQSSSQFISLIIPISTWSCPVVNFSSTISIHVSIIQIVTNKVESDDSINPYHCLPDDNDMTPSVELSLTITNLIRNIKIVSVSVMELKNKTTTLTKTISLKTINLDMNNSRLLLNYTIFVPRDFNP